MIRLALRGLLSRRLATALAAAGLLTAVSGFLVLAGVSRTTQAVLSGDIARAWNTPYDILVRPLGSQTALEQTEGLVRPNFLSGLTGGITEAQLAAIRVVPDVAVAAPIAVVGLVQWPAEFPVDVAKLVGSGPITVFRISAAASGEAGLSHYPPLAAQYLVVAPQGQIVSVQGGPTGPAAAQVLEVGSTKIACTATVACYGGRTPDASLEGAFRSGTPGLDVGWSEPIVVAGIDPVAEAQLAHLDRCVVSGRYLRASDAPGTAASPAGPQPALPVLVSNQSFIDETMQITTERAADPAAVLHGAAPDALTSWAPVSTQTASANDAYQAFVATMIHADYYDASPHWTAGPVTYRQVGPDHLAAVVQPPDVSIYQSAVVIGANGQPANQAPGEASDDWFRSISREDQVPRSELFSRWQPVGQYNPDCLPGFDPLAGGRLEAYGLPVVRLPDGQTLGPTRSLASYVNSPPLVLTTLAGAAWLSDPARFSGAPGAAFISAIRVKVTGVGTPGPAAEAKLATVAAEIHDATGLQVDIVKGASPRTVLVDLPVGIFGRPALTVTEGWSDKGVAVGFVEAVSAEDLALFALVLLGAALLVADTAYVAVRARAPELATLRAIGWSGRRIAWLVEAEILLLGLAVGIVATAVTLALLPLGLVLAPWQLAGAMPLSLAVAGLAGLVPALLVLRGPPIGQLTGLEPGHRSRPIRWLSWLALSDLGGPRRVETGLGVLAVGLGAALVGSVTLVAVGFNGHLDTTVLGVYLAAQVRPFHLAIAGLTLGVGAVAAGEIVSLGYLRREAAFATLRAIGWSPRLIIDFLVLQAFAIGLLGGIAGALVTLILARVLQAATGPTELGVATAIGAALVATLAAAVGPVVLVGRAVPAAILRGE
ncbi:MAG: FtsX-like permease family protein [Candidatus Limnocylindrales bacterium]